MNPASLNIIDALDNGHVIFCSESTSSFSDLSAWWYAKLLCLCNLHHGCLLVSVDCWSTPVLSPSGWVDVLVVLRRTYRRGAAWRNRGWGWTKSMALVIFLGNETCVICLVQWPVIHFISDAIPAMVAIKAEARKNSSEWAMFMSASLCRIRRWIILYLTMSPILLSTVLCFINFAAANIFGKRISVHSFICTWRKVPWWSTSDTLRILNPESQD